MDRIELCINERREGVFGATRTFEGVQEQGIYHRAEGLLLLPPRSGRKRVRVERGVFGPGGDGAAAAAAQGEHHRRPEASRWPEGGEGQTLTRAPRGFELSRTRRGWRGAFWFRSI